jgi:hypothetical protein
VAELTSGVGMSHSSLIATDDPQIWLRHEAIDRDDPHLRDKSGRTGKSAELFRLELLKGGSSEIRNWIAVAAACRDKPMSWHEYVPVYRTPARTGVGLAFGLWQQGR